MKGKRKGKKQSAIEQGGIVNTIIMFFITSFYSGRFPGIPGTAGSIVGYFLWKTWSYTNPRPFSSFLFVLFAGAFGCFLASKALVLMVEGDRNMFVWDEMLGCFIALSFLRPGTYKDETYLILAVFALYRLLNIVKPFPIGVLGRQPGIMGLMSEGIVAGLIAMLVFFLPLESFWVDTLKLVVLEAPKVGL